MEQRKKGYRFSTGLIAGVSSVFIIAGGVAAWWGWTATRGEQAPPWVPEFLQPKSQDQQDPSQDQQDPVKKNPQQIQAKIYWLKVTDNRLDLAATSMAMEAQQPNVAVEKALKSLLEGNIQEPNYTSTIPEGTKLRSVTFQEDGIHIDLSQEFAFGGGSASMMGRVGQIVYTATSLDPEANVWLEVQGEPLEYLGGEGLYIPQPLTREKFKANYQL
ncbi:MAG: hypothetical protein BRC33_05390 [Cyanobacteria bacterium SW_9_44_58]|nr:MAG: hypothetical protein BRC33_05390 [Cyanobacteria bacterium SW_9_44_58]